MCSAFGRWPLSWNIKKHLFCCKTLKVAVGGVKILSALFLLKSAFFCLYWMLPRYSGLGPASTHKCYDWQVTDTSINTWTKVYSRLLLDAIVSPYVVPWVLKKQFSLKTAKNDICIGAANKKCVFFSKKCAPEKSTHAPKV